MADEKLQIDITAKDDASKVVDSLQGKVDKLEKSDPEVDVKADTGKADDEVESFAKKLAKLGDADQVVVLALRAGAAQTELTQLATDLATIDAADPDIDVKLDRYAEVSGQLDDLETKMKAIADTSMDPDVGDKVRTRLQGIGEEAGKTQGAVHSMAGNALGDFAATTTGIGPLGEAIGQLTEMAAGGEAGLKDLATAGLGLGAVSAGMLIVNMAMKSFADAAARVAKIKAFNSDEVDAFTASLNKGTDVTQDFIDKLTEAGKITSQVTFHVGDLDVRQLEDITGLLQEAGISATEFAAGVTGTDEDLARFSTAVAATNLTLGQQQILLSAATNEHDNAATAVANHKRFLDVFGDSTADTTKKVHSFNDQTDELVGSLGKAATKLKEMTEAQSKLSDQISGDQAMIDLANQLADVTDAGDAAIKAQADANTAIKQNATDATAKQREAEQAMRDYQTAVNDAKQDIIHLAETANVNPVELKATLDKVDEGDLAGAKADAEAWSRRNPVKLTATWASILPPNLAALLPGGKATVTVGQTAAPSTTNVTNFLAVPDARRQATQAQRTARVNGRR